MDPVILTWTVVACAIAAYFAVAFYNGVVFLDKQVYKARANIDVLLKQRADEVPNLLAIVRGYAEYEHEVQGRLAKARAPGVAAGASFPKALGTFFSQSFALVEKYPDIKASEIFLGLQERITLLEDRIGDQRTFYNDTVNLYNTRIGSLPWALFAWPLRLTPHELLPPQ